MPHFKVGHRPKTMEIHGKKWGEIVLSRLEASGISEGYEHRKSLINPSHFPGNKSCQYLETKPFGR